MTALGKGGNIPLQNFSIIYKKIIKVLFKIYIVGRLHEKVKTFIQLI